MQILVTNDDGINAPGIRALCKELITLGDVTVVAPDSEKSATSQSITVHHPIRVDQHIIPGIEAPGWRVGGTPTDCVKLALEALLEHRPDIVVSGINQGGNLGTDVLYSGTVSAAIEAALFNIPAVAVSLDSRHSPDFSPAAKFTRKFVSTMVKQQLPPNTLININVPDCAEDEMKGPIITKLGIRQYENTFQKRVDPRGRTYFWMGGSVVENNTDTDTETDIAVIKNKYIAITPIHFDLTNYNIMDLVKQWPL